MINRYLIAGLLIFFSIVVTIAQPSIEWQRTYGGTQQDISRSITETSDGGFIFCASTFSKNGDVSSNNGSADYWIVKIDQHGNIEWEKPYGGGGLDSPKSIKQTADQGFVVVGSSDSSSGDVIGNHGREDMWVLKLDENGDLDWQQSIGGSEYDEGRSILQTFDGGYIVAGSTTSTDGDISLNKGMFDFLVVKLSGLGDIEWIQTYGGSDNDTANSIQQTNDSGFIVTGRSYSSDMDVTINQGKGDVWLVKLDNVGMIEWEKSLGGSEVEDGESVIQTIDGGYIVGGFSSSSNGDVTTNKGLSDYLLVKLSSQGVIEWENTYGGSDYDIAASVRESSDGYIVAGHSSSQDGNISNPHGNGDYWIIKTSFEGNLIWEKSLGGSNYDFGEAMHLTSDGGYILSGYTQSEDGDVTHRIGGPDIWITKLNGCGLNRDVIVKEDTIQANADPGTTTFQWMDCQDSTLILNETSQTFIPTISGQYAVIVNKDNCVDTSACQLICLVNTDVALTNDTLQAWADPIASSFQWLDCNSDTVIINETDYSFAPSLSGEYAAIISQGLCIDTSSCNLVCKIDISLDVVDNTIQSLVDVDLNSYQWMDCNTNDLIVGEEGFFFMPEISGDYAAIITQGSCIDTTECVPIIISDIKEVDLFKPEIYPNPAVDQITIVSPLQLIGSAYNLYNNVGEEIITDRINNVYSVLDISVLNQGIYYLNVHSPNGIISFKIVKI